MPTSYLSDAVVLPHLHPLPTRRSSDLTTATSRISSACFRGTTSTPAGRQDWRPPFGVPWSFAAIRRPAGRRRGEDRKSTRLNSSHLVISYAVFCLKKKMRLQYIYQ